MSKSWEAYISQQEEAEIGKCIEMRKKYNLPIDKINVIDCEEECPAYNECNKN